MSKLIKIAGFGAISLAVLAGLTLLGLSLPIAGRKAMSVQTGSMEPGIKAGSLVFVNRVPAATIVTGDVITYINPLNKNQTITHRVVQVLETNGSRRFVTKGDANYSPDQPISESHIVGRVDAVLPYAGLGRDFLFTWPGLVLLVYLPALIISIGEIRRLAAYYRSQRYVLPELLHRCAANGIGRNLVATALVGLASLAFAWPVYAALVTTATMTGNSISIAAGTPPAVGEGQVSLRRVFLACSADNPGVVSSIQVVLYNGSRQDVTADGWYFQTGGAKLFTLPAGTTVQDRSTHDVQIPPHEGITYDNGSLELRTAAGNLVGQSDWSRSVTDRTCRITL